MFIFQPIPVTQKRRRLLKNGNFVNKPYVGGLSSNHDVKEDAHSSQKVLTYDILNEAFFILVILFAKILYIIKLSIMMYLHYIRKWMMKHLFV